MTSQKFLRIVVGFFIGLATADLALAQSDQALPEGALLKPAPDFSRWTIEYTYPADAVKNPDLPHTVVTTKTRQVIHEETVTVSGKKNESWQKGEDFYTKIPERNTWAAYEKPTQLQIDSGSAVIMTFPKNGFRNLDWIGAKSYIGSLKAKEATYLVFVPNADGLDVSNTKALQTQPTIAYIDGDTRLPARVTENGVVRTYKFEKIPEVVQKLPDDLSAEIKQGEEIRSKFSAAPSREY